jgi:hypothetical protein
LGEGRGDCDRDQLHAQASDLTDLCPELGQLVTSYVAEVEHIEGNYRRALGQEAMEADRLLESATQGEIGGMSAYRERVSIAFNRLQFQTSSISRIV